MWKTLFLAVALTASALAAMPAQAETRDQLLVTPAWLAEHAKDPGLVILHVGTPAGYQAGHIPGAHLAELSKLTVNVPGGLSFELPPAEQLRAQLQALGISDGSRVIVSFEPEGERSATRTMLTLDAAGFGARSSILDGGLAAWKAAGQPVTDAATPPVTGTLSPLQIHHNIVTAEYVQAHLNTPGYDLIDARAPVFYKGEQVGIAGSVKGHIPGAKNLPFTSVTGPDGKFKSPEELRAMFSAVNVKPGDHVIAYCHIGMQATAVVFAARTLGLDAVLYDGSFQDWSQRALPVENPAAEAAAAVN